MPTNLRSLLETKLNGAGFVTITAVTEPKLNKTLPGPEGRVPNPFFGHVLKTSKLNCQIFQNKVINGYEAMVKRRLVAEGKDPESYTVQPRKWGVRLPNLPIIEHEGQYYLEVIIHKTLSSEYLHNGKPIQPSQIRGWPSVGDNRTPQQGGLEEQVEIRAIKLSNIETITVGGEVLTDLYFS